MGNKITPTFKTPVSSPPITNFEALNANVDALIKWARGIEQKISLIEQATVGFEQSIVQMNSSLEAVCRLLIEQGLIDKDKLHAYAKEYVDAHTAWREEQVRQLSEQMKQKSALWVPPETKKIIPVR